MKIRMRLATLTIIGLLTLSSLPAVAVPPFCVGRLSPDNQVDYHHDRNSCYDNEQYLRLPGDLYPQMSMVDKIVNRNEAFNWEPDEYYRDFTVSAGVTLTIPSGTVIRVFRNFVNNGTIVIQPAAAGARRGTPGASGSPSYAPAHPGLSFGPAADGQVSTASTVSGGSSLLTNYPKVENLLRFRPGPLGGGGGGAGTAGGGPGGGTFVVLARSAIRNNGTITALGAPGFAGGGGGGGGLIILAAEDGARNFGTINVSGGPGGPSSTLNLRGAGPGGGGGAGIVYFVSPEVVTGTITAAGGARGNLVDANASGASVFIGGGSGGSLIGIGGRGGSISAGTIQQAEAGTNGRGFKSVTSRPSSFGSP